MRQGQEDLTKEKEKFKKKNKPSRKATNSKISTMMKRDTRDDSTIFQNIEIPLMFHCLCTPNRKGITS